MLEFRLPDVGEGIAEAEVVEWRVSIGDQVREGDVLVAIETDKAIVEMPSPATGTVSRLGAEAGTILAVGELLVVIDDASPSAGARTPVTHRASGGEESPTSPSAAAASGSPPRPKASPAVRRLALEQRVDLSVLVGSGPGGRVTRQDVEAAIGDDAASPAPAPTDGRDGPAPLDAQPVAPAAHVPPPAAPVPDGAEPTDRRVAVRGLRRQVARHMVTSWRTVPHIIDWRDADATELIEARRCIRTALGPAGGELTYLPLLVKLTATALRHHPLMNASFDEDAGEYILHSRVHIGVAVSVADGLLVPVVHDADRKSVTELHEELGRLVSAARQRQLSPDELRGGTYTVNNYGSIGVGAGTPIIRPPEVGILGVGRIADKVVSVDGVPVVRPTTTVSSVGDHRLHDGATLAAFTAEVVELIEQPLALLAGLR